MQADAVAPIALLVDDDEVVLQIGAHMLAKLGYRVLTAESGEAALAELEQAGEVRLVLFDLSMPGLQPEELYERMRALAPAARFVLITGYSRDASVEAVLDRGCHGFIQKPFRLEELKHTLDALLK